MDKQPIGACSWQCNNGTEATACTATSGCTGLACHICSIRAVPTKAEESSSYRICQPCSSNEQDEGAEGVDAGNKAKRTRSPKKSAGKDEKTHGAKDPHAEEEEMIDLTGDQGRQARRGKKQTIKDPKGTKKRKKQKPAARKHCDSDYCGAANVLVDSHCCYLTHFALKGGCMHSHYKSWQGMHHLYHLSCTFL